MIKYDDKLLRMNTQSFNYKNCSKLTKIDNVLEIFYNKGLMRMKFWKEIGIKIKINLLLRYKL